MNARIRNKFSQYERKAFVAKGEDPAQQHFREEVNINNIIAKYNKTGLITHVSKTRKRFGEFKDFADLLPDLDRVTKAHQAFDDLPATIRNEFGNSIEGFFKFIQNPANNEQCVKWGIFDPPKKEVGDSTLSRPKPPEAAPQSTKTGKIKARVIEQSEQGEAD